MKKMTRFLAEAVLLVMTLTLGGCGSGSTESSVSTGSPVNTTTTMSAYQGTWIVAAKNANGILAGVGIFTVQGSGGLTVIDSGGIIVSGNVTDTGVLTFNATPPNGNVLATGTLLTNDTGSGTWIETNNFGAQIASGTFQVWRANGSAYAGNWTVLVPNNGTGTVAIDSNGIISGTLAVVEGNITVSGVVTGAGLVVVRWINGTTTSLGNAPASGTASGSSASGTWESNNGFSGTWTATKN